MNDTPRPLTMTPELEAQIRHILELTYGLDYIDGVALCTELDATRAALTEAEQRILGLEETIIEMRSDILEAHGPSDHGEEFSK